MKTLEKHARKPSPNQKPRHVIHRPLAALHTAAVGAPDDVYSVRYASLRGGTLKRISLDEKSVEIE